MSEVCARINLELWAALIQLHHQYNLSERLQLKAQRKTYNTLKIEKAVCNHLENNLLDAENHP